MVAKFITDRIATWLVAASAMVCFLVLLAIAVFIFKDGLPAFREIGIFDFLFGTVWRPGQDQYGIAGMIIGSLLVTAGSLLLAVPLGIACAILLAEVAPYRVRQIIRPAVELLVGIPSVVYGLVGLVLLVPAIGRIAGSGFSVLAASIVLMAMVLPTIISITEDSIRAVPVSYKEGALALGATHWQAIRQVILPAAKSGIGAAVVLGMGRAVGETMAMIMVIGNSILIPKSPFDPARTLTGNIAVEISYATGVHESALFATGIVLFLFILLLNSIAVISLKRGNHAPIVT
ncbi:MAG: phosphate ABC transporter permease subunit PstC [Dehalococcoidales bacterium]|nr:phosphate ABC transporter permease subunit PstC [Dehalococcoidales bacterium]